MSKKKDIELCKKYGIVPNVEKRWESGIPHHPKAIEIFNLIRRADVSFGGDYFDWKCGGDGDNGEEILYSLSILLELLDCEEEKETLAN